MNEPPSLPGMLNPGSCRRITGQIPFPLPHPSRFGAQQLLAHPSKDQAGGTATSITSREPQPQNCPITVGVTQWHPGPGRDSSHGPETCRGKAGGKVEGDKTNREMFYFGGCVRLRMSSHQLQGAQGMMRNSQEYWLRMSPAPVSAGITAPCHLHSLGCSHPRAKPNFPRDTAAPWDRQRWMSVLNIYQRCGIYWKHPLGGNACSTACSCSRAVPRWAEGGGGGGRMLRRRLQSRKPDALLGINEEPQTLGTQPPGMKRRNKQTRR